MVLKKSNKARLLPSPQHKKKKKLWARVGCLSSSCTKKKKTNSSKGRKDPAASSKGKRGSGRSCNGKRRTTVTTKKITTTTTTTTTVSVKAKKEKKEKASPREGKDKQKAASPSLSKRKKNAEDTMRGSSSSSSRSNMGKCKSKKSKVYVLELEGGYVYVGKTSRSISTRLAEHMRFSRRFSGAAFTKLHRPTGRLLPRLGNLEGDGDGPERDETLRQMRKRGPQRVRGWKYTRQGLLGPVELAEIEANMREVFDLCRKCGRKGHFTMQCSGGSGVVKAG